MYSIAVDNIYNHMGWWNDQSGTSSIYGYVLESFDGYTPIPDTVAIGGTVIAQLLVIYVPALNGIFGTAPLSLTELIACFGIGALVLIIVEFEKFVRRRSWQGPGVVSS